jgi:hypothetical protein
MRLAASIFVKVFYNERHALHHGVAVNAVNVLRRPHASG